MQCPNCLNEVREGAVFCGSCGAAIPAIAPTVPEPLPVPVPAVPVEPPTVQATSAPSQPSDEQAEYDRQMVEYQRKQAEYEQQQAAYAQYEQQATAQMPPQAAVPPVAQPAYAQPAPKKKTGLIIGIIAAVLLVLGGLTVGGVLIARNALSDAVKDVGTELDGPPAVDGEDVPTEAPTTAGYATAEEAVRAALAEQGYADWVAQVYGEDDESAVYWAGPPNSEFVSEVSVLKNPDGTWTLEQINTLQLGGDVQMAPFNEARLVVEDFLYAIQQDRADDAHSLTIEPFSLDGASAAYSGGQFTAFEVIRVDDQSDGTAWVITSETWYGNTDSMAYYVVPTDAGYRIANVEPVNP